MARKKTAEVKEPDPTLPGHEHIGQRVELDDGKIWTIVRVEQEDLGDIQTRLYYLEKKNTAFQKRCGEDWRKYHRV